MVKFFISTLFFIGFDNLYKVVKYKFGVKSGLNPVRNLTATLPSGIFFSRKQRQSDNVKIILDKLTAFGYLKYPVQDIYPNWFYSPLTQKEFKDVKQPWYMIPDFDSEIGDIKGVWEASRFNWVLDLVLLEQKNQDGLALQQLDLWLNHWCEHNSAYQGPNWKCGQEASIRVMHMITALIGLGELETCHQNVLKFIEVHLKRIEPTLEYAIAQDNNHGTSEATALFIGGSLLNYTNPNLQYEKWQNLGRKWLENRAKKLIMPDGGFSQYSINYHRIMLESYSLSEIVRNKLNLSPFSKKLYLQLQKAIDWLYVFTDENYGDAPNVGANDGAHILNVSSTNYRDFRPTIQLASTLFIGKSYYQKQGNYDKSLIFFKVDKKESKDVKLPNKNQLFRKSGWITAQKNHFFIVFKLPIFQFRPSQCDALHLDVWWKGQNILRDGGTYSYNSTIEDLEYFSGVASHNTAQFDNHQQMPRLSRFLFGAWLKPQEFSYQINQFTCAYQDYLGCKHKRQVKITKKQIYVTDTLINFKQQAVLRWRLQAGQWDLHENTLSNGEIQLTIHSDTPLTLSLIQGEESLYYYHKQPLPVLEIKTSHETNITTVIQDLT